MSDAYKILTIKVDGKDISDIIRKYLISIVIKDEADTKSDTLTIKLANPAELISIPSKGVNIEVLLSDQTSTISKGIYTVDNVKVEAPPETLTIEAKATPFTQSSDYNSLKDKLTTVINSQSLATTLQEIADKANLEFIPSDTIADINHEELHLDAENYLQLMARLAKDYQLLIKPTYGKLVALPKSEGVKSSGSKLGTISLTKQDLTKWSFNFPERAKYTAVSASWHDTELAQTKTISVGDATAGDTYALPATLNSELEATTKAQAKLKQLTKQERSGSLSMIGNPLVQAEMTLSLEGFYPLLNGDWVCQSVTHSLSSSGYTTSASIV